MQRPDWKKYFFEFASLASQRATCLRRKVGAVIVKDNMVVSTGYNGPPRGVPHCRETGCIREQNHVPSGEKHELCRGLHAEQNAIIQAARFGVNITGAELYCSTKPCVICTKMIINSGISRVYYIEDYNDPLAEKIADSSKVEFIKIS
ncbi:MAG: dCMP deaminase family protein [Oligoflexia bacterium]|nr:dCMP deaminase family protein [Oligoflexia bacterium]